MRIIAVRGTQEPLKGGMTEPVVADLGVDVVRLAYPAEIRPWGWKTLPESVVAGREDLRKADTLGPWVGVGYSLGAYLLGHAVAADHLTNCRGVVLIADPLRHRNQCSNPGVPRNRFGIAGERWVPGNVTTLAIPDDPITACPNDNAGRLVANVLTGRMQPLFPQMMNPIYFAQWLSKYPSRHVAYGSARLPDGRTFLEAARDAVEALL